MSLLGIRVLMTGYAVAAVGSTGCLWGIVLLDPPGAALHVAAVGVPLIVAGVIIRPLATRDLRLLAIERHAMGFVSLGSSIALAGAVVFAAANSLFF